MDNEYISIMEFADLAGVSIGDLFGAVLRGELDGLYREVDRKTYISIQALERYQKPAEAPKEEAIQEQPAPAESPAEAHADSPGAKEKEYIAEIERLRESLRDAENKIAEQMLTIQNLSLQLAEMANKSHEITEKALNTINQQQILTAIATRKVPWYKRLLGAGREERQ